MTPEVSAALSEALPLALANTVARHEPQRIVLRSVIMFESITEGGERTMSFFPSQDTRAWDVLGFVAYLQEYTRNWITTESRV